MRPLSKDIAERLLEAFRTKPGVGAHAARHAGVTPQTARNAWQKGLRIGGHPEYRRPFKDILEEEQLEARARMASVEEEARTRAIEAEAQRRMEAQEKAITDATKTREEEAAMVRLARSASMVLLNNITGVAAGAAKLGRKVREALELQAQNPDPLTLAEASRVTTILGRLTTALRQSNDAAQRAIEMERLLLGEPTQILGVAHLDALTVEQARQKLEAAQRALDTISEEGVGQLDGRPIDPNVH